MRVDSVCVKLKTNLVTWQCAACVLHRLTHRILSPTRLHIVPVVVLHNGQAPTLGGGEVVQLHIPFPEAGMATKAQLLWLTLMAPLWGTPMQGHCQNTTARMRTMAAHMACCMLEWHKKQLLPPIVTSSTRRMTGGGAGGGVASV